MPDGKGGIYGDTGRREWCALLDGLKRMARNHAWIMRWRRRVFHLLHPMLTLISPRFNARMRYRHHRKRPINLENPATFCEKLIWLKLNDYATNPLVIRCADKLAVRDYVSSCGFGHMLNPLYGVYERPEQIDWENLPRQFALKWNFGSGMNILCADRDALDRQKALARLKAWGRRKYWLPNAEMHYKRIPRRIVCERYLETEPGDLPFDYKIYCFHGSAKCVMVMSDRNSQLRYRLMSLESWQVICYTDRGEEPRCMDRPACLPDMVRAAEALSQPFPFVRVDFYDYNGVALFGEMTFTPSGGLYEDEADVDGQPMSELIHLPIVPKREKRGKGPVSRHADLSSRRL